MGQPDFGFDMYAVNASFADKDGFLGLQVNTEGSQSNNGAKPAGGAHDYEMLSPGGLNHRPLNPVLDANGNVDPTKAAQCIIFREGGHCVVQVLNDPRVIPILPQIEPGGTCVYAGNGSFVRITGSGENVGRISQFTTTDGTTDGTAVVALTWPDRHQWVGPWGVMTFDDTGFHVGTAGGPRFDMGAMSGGVLPGEFTNYVRIVSATTTIKSSMVTLGSGVNPVAIVLAPQLQQQLAPMAQLMTLMSSMLTTVSSFVTAAAAVVPGGQPIATALGDLTVQLASLTAQITAAAVPYPAPAPYASTSVSAS